MAVYLVTYELRAQERDYATFFAALRSSSHCRPLETFWLVEDKRNAIAIRDSLSRHVDANDGLFVSRVTVDWAAWNANQCSDWLSRELILAGGDEAPPPAMSGSGSP